MIFEIPKEDFCNMKNFDIFYKFTEVFFHDDLCIELYPILKELVEKKDVYGMFTLKNKYDHKTFYDKIDKINSLYNSNEVLTTEKCINIMADINKNKSILYEKNYTLFNEYIQKLTDELLKQLEIQYYQQINKRKQPIASSFIFADNDKIKKYYNRHYLYPNDDYGGDEISTAKSFSDELNIKTMLLKNNKCIDLEGVKNIINTCERLVLFVTRCLHDLDSDLSTTSYYIRNLKEIETEIHTKEYTPSLRNKLLNFFEVNKNKINQKIYDDRVC